MNKKILYTLVILLAVSAAVKSYEYFSYPAAMLVLQIKTLEKGTRSINVIDKNGKNHLLNFEMGNDLGEPSFYTIDLPRVIPQEVRIAPLAARGNFEIDRITIRNEEISYNWDSQGLCTSKKLQHGNIRQETCGDGQPEMTIADDLQLSIRKIPPSGFSPDMVRGIAAGMSSFLATLLAGFWLYRPVNIDNKSGKIGIFIGRGFWLLVLSMYLAQLLAIWQYSADLPFWEEWEYFLPEGLPNGLSWDWLFNFAGYHRVVPTKLMAWLNLQLFGLDFKLQKLFNYFIFAGLLLTLVSLKNRMIGKKDFMLFPAFLLFLLSPIMFENHSNSYQSQIHLVLIFTLMAMFHVYDDSFRAKSVAVFLICLVAAINTFSAGMTIAAVLLPCWAIYVIFRMVDGRITRQKGILLLLLGGMVVSVAAASWILGYRQPSDCIWISPLSGQFWQTFLNLISFGFGFEMENPLPGAIWLLVIIVPVLMLWWDKKLRSEERVWQVSTAILVFMAIIATISITRGNFIGTSKASRYAEFGLMLIPLTSIAWWLALKHVVLRGVVLCLIWLACFVSFFDDWSFSPYRDIGQMELLVVESLEEYSLGRGDGVFPWSHPKPLPPFFEGASKLDVKFTRQYKGLSP